MKKSELKQIIKEEISKALKQTIYDEGYNYFFTTGPISENPYNKDTENEQYSLWNKGFKDASKTLYESQKLNTQQEMKNLMSDILESNKKIKNLMKQKGYEI
jgi:hypothetical protein